MPKGQRELFKVDLLLDRTQRKVLDVIIDKCTSGIGSLVRESVHLTDTLKTLVDISTFESWINDSQMCDQSLNHGTRKEMARLACKKYSKVISGEISVRNSRPNAMVCRFLTEDVLFSMTEKVVRVPHLGICRFAYNNKVMLKIEDMIITKTGDYYSVGYWCQRPTLIVAIKEKKEEILEDFTNQKLVKVTRQKQRV
jgi:hypothetical protein